MATLAFLIVHALVVISIFTLRSLGIISDIFLVALMSVISLEAISLALLTWVRVQKLVSNLKEMAEEIKEIHEEVGDIAKIHRELLYLSHQISHQGKSNGNGHHRRPHPSVISHS